MELSALKTHLQRLGYSTSFTHSDASIFDRSSGIFVRVGNVVWGRKKDFMVDYVVSHHSQLKTDLLLIDIECLTERKPEHRLRGP